jgi:hypothetical protein
MNLLFRLLPIAAAMLAVPALADPSPQQLTAAKEAEARGAEIYAYDQAAWHSTDQFQIDLKKAKLSLEQVSEQGVRGYVVEPAEKGLLLVTYYAQKDGRTWAFARYWMAGSSVRRGRLVKSDEDAALSPLALKLVELRGKAIEAAIEHKAFICNKGTPNTVVLPPRADGTYPAYVMSAATQTGRFPAGGHWRFDFDGQGKLVAHRGFTKSCIDVVTGLPGKTAVGYGVSHSLDTQPTEVHVFVSYNVPIKLFVIIEPGNNLWEIDRGKVAFKQVMPEQPGK